MHTVKAFFIACALLFFTSVSLANNEASGAGTVAETIRSGGYIYVRLKEDNTWLAATPVTLARGDHVRYAGGALMQDFHSFTLNRTFKSILFVMRLEVTDPDNARAHASTAASNPHPHVVVESTTSAAPKADEIEPLEGGQTISQIQSDSAQLKDQQVAVRARVMKISQNILGKNWITLQDGTGRAPNNQLIATSSEEVTVGTLVTARGVLHTNVNLGSGYQYAVLLEEATFAP